jgi:DUF917 family protein
MRELTENDVEHLLIGAEVLGVGGGGTVEEGREMAREVHASGRRFKLVDPRELPDNALVFILAGVGGGVPDDILKRVQRLKVAPEKSVIVAARELSRYLGEEPYAFLASEIGAGNTLVPMYVAAMTGKYTVDADGCGRSKPEVSISTTHVRNLPVTPACEVSSFGDVVILKQAVDDYRAEDICRYVAIICGGDAGLARCPTRGKLIREAVVPNSISKAIEVGAKIDKAKQSGADPVKALIDATYGRRIFEGTLESWEREKKEAFDWGQLLIQGKDLYKDQTLKVYFKNEFLVSWKNEKPYVTCPDLICILDKRDFRGLSNTVADTHKFEGTEVAVVGVPAHPIWRTDRGIEIFGPRHFNFDIDYRPLETIVP